MDGKRGTAGIQFSARPEVEPVWQDVLAGILRHVSVGYSVEEWAEHRPPKRRAPADRRALDAPRDFPGAHARRSRRPHSHGDRDDREHQGRGQHRPLENEASPEPRPMPRIRSIARIAGLDQAWIDGQIDACADADTARRAAFEALASRSAPAIRTEQVRVEIGERGRTRHARPADGRGALRPD